MAVIRDENHIPQVVAQLRLMAAKQVEMGLFADKVHERTLIAARVNEFGARIPKTPKMRAFLAAMMRKYGIKPDPSKGNPDFVIIPPRPFFRTGLRRVEGHLAEVVSKMLDRLFQLQATADDVLAVAGLTMERAVKDQINRVNAPPLHPLTVAMKGSEKPLVHTGVMRNAITWRITGRSSGA